MNFARFRAWTTAVLLCPVTAHATPTTDAQTYDQKQHVLQMQRDAVSQRYGQAAKQCWQIFLVNDCLQQARLDRRRELAPIEKQENALRAAKRAQAVADRQERLEAKKPSVETPDDNPP
jgi:hypothetical protein